MHHFLYPTQDTFITNVSDLDDLNFGLNEVLRVGTEYVTTKVVSQTTPIVLSVSASNLCVNNFSGSIIDTSLYGTASVSSGTIYNTVDSVLKSVNFSGIATASYVSASVTGSITGSLTGFTGSLNGRFSGSVSSVFITDNAIFNGSVSGFTGKFINGIINGTEFLNRQNTEVSTNLYAYRALLQFDLTAISKSVANGDITNPQFTLKMNVARAEELPIQYNLYAFPISESWVMGNGYYYDNGSTVGASWIYRDQQNGTTWATTGSTYIQSLSATQSFDYETGDVSMDVTPIVNAWINGSVTNNGLVVLSSDEFSVTGSGMTLYFFSRDTNTIYSPHLDAAWNDAQIITGSVGTGSVVISSIPPGVTGSYVNTTSSITGVDVSGSVFGVMNVTVDANNSASGLISLTGTSGTVTDVPIFGSVSGSIQIITTTSSFTFPGFGPLFDLPPEDIDTFNSFFGYFPFVNTTNTYTTTQSVPVLNAQILDGNFSGSYISASITNHVQLTGGITGSWLVSQSLCLTTITASYPFLNYPSAVVTFEGPFIHGNGFGQFSSVNYNPGSGIWTGTIIYGNLAGAHLVFPFSGSLSTSSVSFTSSISIISSSLQPLKISSPFVVSVKIPEKVKTNEIIKVKVFGREQFPLKNFQRTPQFSQYITPLYLPSSSFYSIKDNETEEIILDFDNYTRISTEPSGSYFLLDTSGLPQERYFKIIIKMEDAGLVYIVDNNDIFKVVR